MVLVGDLDKCIPACRVGVLAHGCSEDSMEKCISELLLLMQDTEFQKRCRQTAEKLLSLQSGISLYHRLYLHSMRLQPDAFQPSLAPVVT